VKDINLFATYITRLTILTHVEHFAVKNYHIYNV